jgi:hypothetical protein
MCHGFDYRRERIQTPAEPDEEVPDEPSFAREGDPEVELDREFEERDAETPADD